MEITLLPSPELSLLAPSFEAKYAGVSEKFLRGIRLREQVSKVPSFPKTGTRVRPQVIPTNENMKVKILISSTVTL